MRVVVCGLGKVGKPILDRMRSRGIDVLGYDCDPEKTEAPIEKARMHAEVVYYIVPTPSECNGSFSSHHLKSAMYLFRSDSLMIVGSTVTPGTCKDLMWLTKGRICYQPQLIRLEFVNEDLASPYFHLIGESDSKSGDICEQLCKEMSDAPVHRMSLLEAELAKITLNCALTMKISLANQLYLVASKVGADADKIMNCVGSDPRIGKQYLKPGTAYGGPCLPRDNRMFAYYAKSIGGIAPLSLAADVINEMMQP